MVARSFPCPLVPPVPGALVTFRTSTANRPQRRARLKLARGILLGAALTAAVAPGTAQAASWTAPRDLSSPSADTPDPVVAGAGTGIFAAVWARDISSTRPVEASLRSAAGVWTAPILTSNAATTAFLPTVAVNASGQAATAWVAGGMFNVAVRSTGGGWSAPRSFGTASSFATDVGVVIDAAGVVTLVWTDFAIPASPRVVASSRNASGVWSTPQPIADANTGLDDLDVSGDGTVTALLAAPTGVQVATKSPSGTWTAPVGISPSGQATDGGRLDVARSGAAVAAWVVPGTPVDRVAGTVRTASGTWAPAALLSPADARVRRPEAAVTPSGTAVVGWQRVDAEDDEDVTRSAVVVSSRPPGGGWGAATQISPVGATRQDGALDLAADPTETATAVWDNDGRILSAVRSADGSWSSPTVVSGLESGNSFAAIAADEQGEVTAVWQRFHTDQKWVTAASLVNRDPPGTDVDPEPKPEPTSDPEPGVVPQPQVQAPVQPPVLPAPAPIQAPQAVKASAKLSATKVKRGKRLTVHVVGVPNRARLVVSWKPRRGKAVAATALVTKGRALVVAPKKRGRYRVTVTYKGRVLVRGRTVVVR